MDGEVRSTRAAAAPTPRTVRTTGRSPWASSSPAPWRRAPARCRCAHASPPPSSPRGGGTSPGRTVHQHRRGDRLDQVLHRRALRRPRTAHLRGGARHRPGRTQPAARPPPAPVRPEAVHPQPLRARRHDRQQLLRRLRPGLRQDRRQRPPPGDPHLRRAARRGSAPPPPDERARIIAGGGRLAEIYAGLDRIATEYLADIRRGYPKIPRRVSGYNLDSLLPENGFGRGQGARRQRGHPWSPSCAPNSTSCPCPRTSRCSSSATTTSAPPPTTCPACWSTATPPNWRPWTTGWPS